MVIGIGIDDMFIIYSSFVYTNKKREGSRIDIEETIKKTMARSGVSITITSLTDFVAFLVGVTTDFPSVQIFCVYAGVSILFCFFYQLTFFAGFLCLHLVRVQKKHNAFLVCVSQERFNKLGVCAKFACFDSKNSLDEMDDSNDDRNSTELVELKPASSQSPQSLEQDQSQQEKTVVKKVRKNSKYDTKIKV